MKANLGIPEAHLQQIALLLNSLLADEYLLYTKTKYYHWNVTGPHFGELHRLFDEQAEALEDIIDEVAERVRALGFLSAGTMKDFLTLAQLLEDNGQIPDGLEMVFALLGDHETLIHRLRKGIDEAARLGDAGTSDLLTGFIEQHEKLAWMLRAHRSVNEMDAPLKQAFHSAMGRK